MSSITRSKKYEVWYWYIHFIWKGLICNVLHNQCAPEHCNKNITLQIWGRNLNGLNCWYVSVNPFLMARTPIQFKRSVLYLAYTTYMIIVLKRWPTWMYIECIQMIVHCSINNEMDNIINWSIWCYYCAPCGF